MRMTFRTLNRIITQFLALAIIAGATSTGYAETNLLEVGYRQMYNLQFDKAHRTFLEWGRIHPEDPMAPVSEAATYLFTEFDRLHILELQFLVDGERAKTGRRLPPDPVVKENFETALNHAAELASRAPQGPDAGLATVLSHGLLAEYLGLIEKRNVAALKEIKIARVLAQQVLAVHPDNYDAWIAVGVENYMLSVKSAPVRWALRMGGAQTDRTLGIAELQLTADKGRYLAPFARLLLAVAALRDRNTSRAHELLVALAREFPNNPLYKLEVAGLSN
jgi:hypothetical protein